MNPLSDIFAGQEGVTMRTYCSWCPNESTGTLTLMDGEQDIDLPICESCVRAIAERHRKKMDGLDAIEQGSNTLDHGR